MCSAQADVCFVPIAITVSTRSRMRSAVVLMVCAVAAAGDYHCHQRQTDHSQKRNDEKCGIDHDGHPPAYFPSTLVAQLLLRSKRHRHNSTQMELWRDECLLSALVHEKVICLSHRYRHSVYRCKAAVSFPPRSVARCPLCTKPRSSVARLFLARPLGSKPSGTE
jgi:hypothetical protein